jgi:glyoxalase family protein
MRLEGVHHVTAITGDVLQNVNFYTGVLGLRLAAKSVNQDDPSVYHVFYSDEHGQPGADITFFEYRGAPRGRAGAGMVHRVLWRVTGEPALAFWRDRLAAHSVTAVREGAIAALLRPRGPRARAGRRERAGRAARGATIPRSPARWRYRASTVSAPMAVA